MHFVVKSEIDVFLLFVLFALVETIDDTVKFVYGHTQWAPDTRKRLWKSAVEILNWPEDLNISRAGRKKGEFPIVLRTIYFLVRHRFCKERQSKNLLNSGKFCCIGVLPIFHCYNKLKVLTFIWSFVSSIIPIFQIIPFCSFFFFTKKGLIKINRSLNCQIK